MTNGQVFKHHVWIVNTLRQGGRMTMADLNERWVNDKMTDGNPLPRSSFNKYRTDILYMFGLRIECDKQYRYYISVTRDRSAVRSCVFGKKFFR